MRSPHPKQLLTFVVLASLKLAPLAAQQPQDSAAVQLALSATTTWLALLDQGKYEQSWDAAAPAFQSAVTKTAWTQALSQARGPFEPFGARTLLGTRYAETLPGAPPGPYVVVQYQTKVAGDRQVVETITPMRTPDGSWRVSGYFVRPSP